ncbi:MAG: hemolysin III family protein [Bifidobacteriaceae bacterium]|nr:hemolysin III family protein [Bifidobacteriaceae bacterium]
MTVLLAPTEAPPSAEPPKPRLRGWFHAGMSPLVIAAGATLIALANGSAAKAACSVYVATAIMLFCTSAIYHLGHWGQVAAGVLRRLDHSNIALIIAGTYTPLALLLDHSTTVKLLWIIWVGALAAILIRVLWLNAPRWTYVPIYIVLGWTAIWFMPQFWRAGGPGIVWLLIAGGLAYTGGAVVYALKRPNPSPRWFGFHEIFHLGTVVGFTCHFIAVTIASVN